MSIHRKKYTKIAVIDPICKKISVRTKTACLQEMGWVGVSGLTRKVLIKLSPMPEAVNEKWSRGQLARMIHIFCKIFALQDRAVCWRPKWYIDHPVRSKPKCLHFLLELEAQEHDMIKVHRTHLHAQTPSGHCQELLTLQRPPLQHSASLLACWVFLGRPRIKLRKSYRKKHS